MSTYKKTHIEMIPYFFAKMSLPQNKNSHFTLKWKGEENREQFVVVVEQRKPVWQLKFRNFGLHGKPNIFLAGGGFKKKIKLKIRQTDRQTKKDNYSGSCLIQIQIIYFKSLSYTWYFLNWKWYRQSTNYFTQKKNKIKNNPNKSNTIKLL